VAAGLVVLLMSATGVLLTYQRQLTAWADARAVGVARPAPGAVRLPAESLLARVRAAQPGTPTAVTWRAAPGAPVEVAYGRERTLFVDAYSGAVRGEGATTTRAFFRRVTELHRWIGAVGDRRELGKAVTGAANLAFLFLVVSGAYLWWPRSWTRGAVRNVALLRGGLRGKARDFNWHNVVGLWSAIPLFVVVLSGVVISYPWATALVYRVVGERPPAPPAAAERAGGQGGRRGEGRGTGADEPGAGFDAARAAAIARVPGWRSATVQLPRGAVPTLAVAVDAGSGGQPQHRATLTVDRATGRELRWEPFAGQTAGRRLRSVLRFAHTGEVLGLAGQTVAGLVSLGATLLVWTGLALSGRRLLAWRGRRQRWAEARPAGAERAERAA
jgi:uncharacterized iron-regulated membrane protein